MQTFSDWVQFSVSAAVVLLLLSILLSLIVLIIRRSQRAGREEGLAFSIEHLNETWKKREDFIRKEILSNKEFKQLLKEREKDEKQKNQPEVHSTKKRVFVVDFEGDVSASECSTLRDSISALLSIVRKQDEVVVRLESPGGVVHGYGLAASQLARLRERNIHLTVCVDKVAASGGYMMACVANKIVAAPFSVIGSIGVLSSTPNFNRLLKKHDVDFIEQTAGEYKRTLTLFGEINDKKKAKHQEDIDIIHSLFKDHVSHHRPQVDITTVSTGEIWLGRHALEKRLVDELKTSDDLLLELGQTADVYLLKSEQELNWKTKLMKHFFGALANTKIPLAMMQG